MMTKRGRSARKTATGKSSATSNRVVKPRVSKNNGSSAHADEDADRFPIVGIGASAGGLDAFEKLFKAMPADPGMAFVVVQHLSPDHKSILSELIGKFTTMPVSEVADGVTVALNHIYVIPPDKDLGILNGALRIIETTEPRGHRHPIDFFFRSLADDQCENAICIVLSGTGSEGSLGLKAIKEKGGIVIVQDPETATYDGMPRNAVATGLADFILPAGEMASVLAEISQGDLGKYLTKSRGEQLGHTDELQRVFALIRSQTGHDLSLYKKNTIIRRIERRMMVHRIGNLSLYTRFLQENPGEVTRLFKEVLIGVTNFFRDKDAFETLRTKALPALFAKRAPGEEVRIWVPGCSTGEEAYTIAILMRDYMDRNSVEFPVTLFATDIDAEAINTARTGLFPAAVSTNVSSDILKHYFVFEEGHYRVKKAVRDMLVFAEHNVVRDAPFSRMDLISCRNLLIYMGPELQKKLFPLFQYALKPHGFLFLGTSETLFDPGNLFETEDRKWKLFRRRPGRTAGFPMLSFTAAPPKSQTKMRQQGEETSRDKGEYRELMERTLLAEFTPTCLLVNEKAEVLFIHGRTGNYFEMPAGELTRDVVAMAREGLRLVLAAGLRHVVKKNEIFQRSCLKVMANGTEQFVKLTLKPIYAPPAMRGLVMILIEDVPQPEAGPGDDASEVPPRESALIGELEYELRVTKEHLQTTIEQLEISNEELQSSNEELQSSNEELQSTNEEHETAKEELQSVNEELVTVNSELESKVEELGKVNNDMTNLLASTDIGTIFLDLDLRISRFTPAATRVINLIAADVGRPLAHIASNLEYPNLISDVESVLNTLNTTEVEANTVDGIWYLIRILPYRTMDNVIDGVVVTFVDITERKRRMETDSRLAIVLRDSSDAVTVQDFSGTILAWNKGAETMYGISEQEALGANINQTVPPELRQEFSALIDRVRSGERIVNFKTMRCGREGNEFQVWLTASVLRDKSGNPFAVATTERDITWLVDSGS